MPRQKERLYGSEARMSLWDKAKKALDSAAASVNREAKQLGKHREIGELEEEIQRQYAEIGQRARELYGQRTLVDPEIAVLVKRIQELERQIQKLREELQAIRSSGDDAPRS